ncbi:hypothetical protein GGR57DRAFT_292614 [Xylariaceae sp. FL1272]|nr:hypothetical protein GGR57DRAFT_292614 [Xylariaceae sp. FL1272]
MRVPHESRRAVRMRLSGLRTQPSVSPSPEPFMRGYLEYQAGTYLGITLPMLGTLDSFGPTISCKLSLFTLARCLAAMFISYLMYCKSLRKHPVCSAPASRSWSSLEIQVSREPNVCKGCWFCAGMHCAGPAGYLSDPNNKTGWSPGWPRAPAPLHNWCWPSSSHNSSPRTLSLPKYCLHEYHPGLIDHKSRYPKSSNIV